MNIPELPRPFCFQEAMHSDPSHPTHHLYPAPPSPAGECPTGRVSPLSPRPLGCWTGPDRGGVGGAVLSPSWIGPLIFGANLGSRFMSSPLLVLKKDVHLYRGANLMFITLGSFVNYDYNTPPLFIMFGGRLPTICPELIYTPVII